MEYDRLMDGCIFCRIASQDAPAGAVYADDEIVAFHDLNPQAPVHVLVVPRRHVPSVAVADGPDGALLGRLLLAAAEVARRTGIDASGFRIVTNTGREAGQSVLHLHFHVLGGRRFGWPPG
jgi:histidine triad (HIT) family protein